MIFLVPIYALLIRLYITLVRVASLFNTKAEKFIKGRKGLLNKVKYDLINERRPRIWIHCASLGEFEQGRPIIEAMRNKYKDHAIVLTFFSPSGYEIRKNYDKVDNVFYLPYDTPSNAKRFIQYVEPSLVVFIKYEFWYFMLKEIANNDIPLLLVSAIFRKEQPFFQWYGTLNRNMVRVFTHIFVQDEYSKQLLNNIGIEDVSVNGDTRFDRVAALKTEELHIDEIVDFKGSLKLFIAGSTWPEDEALLKQLLLKTDGWKMIIAPHEITLTHLKQLKKQFGDDVCFWTKVKSGEESIKNNNVLVIDKIGMLSRLYRYADACYIGGGFNKSGIHNVLEAAVYGKPIFHGPNYGKFKEAVTLNEEGAAISVATADPIVGQLSEWEKDTGSYDLTCKTAESYVLKNVGATNRVMNYLDEKKLLSNS